MRILLFAGARPNFMKIEPVLRALSARLGPGEVGWVHSGQHTDASMSEEIWTQLRLPEPLARIATNTTSAPARFSQMLSGAESVLRRLRPRAVLVPGDVDATLVVALAATRLDVPVIHLEAGLRSFDRSMPEETNRIVVDNLSQLLLVSEPSGITNLQNEGIQGDQVQLIGNTMIDSLRNILSFTETPADSREASRFVLATIHRPNNVDSSRRLREIVAIFNDLSTEIPVLWPAHPRTGRALDSAGIRVAEGVTISAPMTYPSFLDHLSRSTLVLTDSGGVQEEAAALRIPTITLRPSTERPLTVEAGGNFLEGEPPVDVFSLARSILSGRIRPKIDERMLIHAGWDGHAGARAASCILNAFS